MKKYSDISKQLGLLTDNKEKNYLQICPAYSTCNDIYSKYQEEKDTKPDETFESYESKDRDGTNNENYFSDDISSRDLDVTSSGLNDKQENIESKDKENIFSSF